MRCINVDEKYPVNSFSSDAKQGGIALIHSPSCGHCIAMKDEWDAFEKDIPNFKQSIGGDPNIFRISANTVGNLGHGIPSAVRGVPTILIINPGATVGKIYDSNERTKQNFLDFFKKGFPKTSAVKKPSLTITSSKKTRGTRRKKSQPSSKSLIISGGGYRTKRKSRRAKSRRAKSRRVKSRRTK